MRDKTHAVGMARQLVAEFESYVSLYIERNAPDVQQVKSPVFVNRTKTKMD